MKPYLDMINEVLLFGSRKENRTGVDTISTFNYNYEISWDPRLLGTGVHVIGTGKEAEGVWPVPLLTTKEVSWKNIVVEMLWFLSGEPTIEILQRHGCKFWDAWADEDGNVPMAYGEQWRRFPVHTHKDTSGTVAHMATNDGTAAFCQGNSPRQDHFRLLPIHALPKNWKWCDQCVEVWKESRPSEEVPPPRLSKHQGPAEAGFNDQIKWALNQLRSNPMNRRLVVSAWAPGQAQTAGLPPCHMIFAFNVQNVEESLEDAIRRARENEGPEYKGVKDQLVNEYITTEEGRAKLRASLVSAGFAPKVEQRLCLHLTQRSCDLALGVPYNMASYGLLLLIFSHLTGIKPGIFAHTLLDLHIYTSKPDGSKAEYDHVPGLQIQAQRDLRPLPTLTIDPSIKELEDIEALMAPEVTTEQILEKFKLSGYDPHPGLKFKVAV